MKQINSGKVIIIPDIHQNTAYIDAILNKEKNFDHCVFLGDWLDCYEPIDNITHFSVKETCKWINGHIDDDRFIWLIGNHCISYLSTYRKGQPAKRHFNHTYPCSGWTRSKASDFNRYISEKFINKLELTCRVGNYYCVHGGFHYDQFKPILTEDENIEALYDDWEKTKHSFMHNEDHWIGKVSSFRGGLDRCSSPTWLDWYEYVPMDTTQIICGHSNLRPDESGVKQNGIGLKSYCIDRHQTSYAVWENGDVRIDTITDKDYSNFLSI